MICWAHYAPPINDLFRKSYRRLLRWNDEFPFAKFSIGEDERPLLAVELPTSALADGPDALGLALARIVGVADALFDESTDWLWLGGKVPDQSARTLEERAAHRPIRTPAARAVRRPPGCERRRPGRGGPGMTGGRARRLGLTVLALIFAIGLLAAPPAASEVRAATPDLTIVSNATYQVRPGDRLVRVTVDMTLKNNLRDTATRRYFFDTAFLAVLPGTSGFRVNGSGGPSVRATRRNNDYTLLRINLGQPAVQRQDHEVPPDVRPQGLRRVEHPRRPRR